MVVVAPANRQTLYPGSAATLEASAAVLQPWFPAAAELPPLLDEQPTAARPSAAAMVADEAILAMVVTRCTPSLMRVFVLRHAFGLLP